MNKDYTWRRIALFCIVLTHGAPGMCRDVGNFKGLTIAIGATVQDILPVEPLPITFTLSNNTANPIAGHVQINPGTGFVQIYVARDDQPFELFHSADWASSTGVYARDILPPGFQTSVRGYLFYAHLAGMDKGERGRYLFESPGTYRLKATFADLDGEATIESNVLTIRVKEPTGPDTPAYEFLRSLGQARTANLPYGDFLLTTFGRSMTSESQRVREEKEEFISRFPDSQYAKYVYYSLGDDYRLGVGKGVERGIDYLKKAASYERFFLAYQAMTKLIDTLAEQNRTQEAEDYKKLLASRYPDSGRGRDYREEAYEEGHRETHRRSWLIAGVAVVGVLVVAFAAVYLFVRRGGQGRRFL